MSNYSLCLSILKRLIGFEETSSGEKMTLPDEIEIDTLITYKDYFIHCKNDRIRNDDIDTERKQVDLLLEEVDVLQFKAKGGESELNRFFDKRLSFVEKMKPDGDADGDGESFFLDVLADYVDSYKKSRFSKIGSSIKEKGKKIFMSIWNSFRRTTAFVDFFTDARLLYLVSNANLLGFTVVLSLSIICPYIVSYSCGVKLLFINEHWNNNNNNNNNNSTNNSNTQYLALKRILWYLAISPVGVLYFIFLDFIDVLFSYYKLIVILLFGKSDFEMKLLEETVANQLHMSSMDYEGIKRQRGVAQLS